jgi:oligoendopeptidase F
MGHAMHSYYSDNNQDYLYAGYPIFLAEIASTVNEVLLSEYLINNSKTKEEKNYYLVEFLDKFKATVYRQVMFANFESLIHEKFESGEALTMELLCEEYLKLNKKHYSPVVKVDDTIKYEWARIPHFYDSFYVYKYATGLISALCIVDKLKKEEGFNEKYIKDFLSRGGSDYPLNILKGIGIDITDESTLDSAFDMFEDKLNELESLVMKRRK